MRYLLTHRPTVVYLSVLILLSIALWIPRLRGPIDLRYDAGVYYILGASLEQGKGYRLLNEPGEIQAIQYPPLLPLFAAVHQRLAGTNHPAVAGHWMRVSFFVIFLGFVVAVYRLSRHYLTPGAAFLAALVVLLHVHTTWMSELFFAELPFALTSVLFLLVVLHAKERSREWIAGLLGAVSFLLRTVGIALLIAWIAESLLKRRFREMALRITLAFIPVIAWQGYIAHVKSGPQYSRTAYEYQRADYQFYNVGYLKNLMYVDSFVPELGRLSPPLLMKRITHNLTRIPAAFGGAVSADPERVTSKLKRINQRFARLQVPLWTADVAFVALGTLVVFGLMLLARRGEWLIVVYVAASAGFMCLTPWPGQFIRYMWPTAPLLAIALLTALMGIRHSLFASTNRGVRTFAVSFIGVVLIGIFALELFAIGKSYQLSATASYHTESGNEREYRLFFYTPAWQLHDEALDWLAREANLDEIVATTTPHWLHLKSGLRAIMPPFESDVNAAQQLMDSVPVSYLVLDRLEFVNVSRRYAEPPVETFPERWKLVYSSGKRGSRVYRRLSPGTNFVKHPISISEFKTDSKFY